MIASNFSVRQSLVKYLVENYYCVKKGVVKERCCVKNFILKYYSHLNKKDFIPMNICAILKSLIKYFQAKKSFIAH